MKSKIKLLLMLIIAGIGIMKAQTQEVKKFTLNEAITFAKQNNVSYQNARLDELTAQKSVNELLANGLPQANGELSYNRNIDIPVTPLPDFITPSVIFANQKYFGLSPTEKYVQGQPVPVAFGQKNSATASLTIGQLLFDGTFFLGMKAAKEYVNYLL
ncbi:MAG: hypothetical protein EBQ78_13290 [Betaproteobacteria bacterium]|nr:hypothetical protein [Betaproteobacteria bacterium]